MWALKKKGTNMYNPHTPYNEDEVLYNNHLTNIPERIARYVHKGYAKRVKLNYLYPYSENDFELVEIEPYNDEKLAYISILDNSYHNYKSLLLLNKIQCFYTVDNGFKVIEIKCKDVQKAVNIIKKKNNNNIAFEIHLTNSEAINYRSEYWKE